MLKYGYLCARVCVFVCLLLQGSGDKGNIQVLFYFIDIHRPCNLPRWSTHHGGYCVQSGTLSLIYSITSLISTLFTIDTSSSSCGGGGSGSGRGSGGDSSANL